MLFRVIFFSSIFFALTLSAQTISTIERLTPPTAHARFERINTANGLSNNEVTCIFQDRDGFMWFGTADGLNKYDGYTMTVFRSDDAHPWTTIPSNQINAITQDEAGNIWVGTKSGVAILNRQTQAWERFPRGVKDSLGKPISFDVGNMNADRHGNIWLKTENSILSRYDYRSRKHIVYLEQRQSKSNFAYLKPDTVLPVRFIAWGNLLFNGIGSDTDVYLTGSDTVQGYIYRYNHTRRSFSILTGYCPTRNNAVADDGQNLWYSIEQPIPNAKGKQVRLVVTNKAGKGTQILQNFSSIFSSVPIQNEIWCAIPYKGILRMNPDTKKPVGLIAIDPSSPTGLPGDWLHILYKDRSGVVWVGTDNGIAKCIPSPVSIIEKSYADTASLPSKSIYAVCEDSVGSIWIGTAKGLSKFERSAGTVKTFTRPHTIHPRHINDIRALCIEYSDVNPKRNNNLWVASWGMGLMRFDLQQEKYVSRIQRLQPVATNFPFPGWVSSIVQTAPDSLCFNSWGGPYWILNLTNPDAVDTLIPRMTVKDSSFQYKKGMSLYPHLLWGYLNLHITLDKQGTLWSAGEGDGNGKISGLFRKQYGENWTLIAKPNKNDTTSLSTDIIHAIYESVRGDLWLGTADGLCRFDRQTLKVRRFSLPNNVVMAIQEDNHGNLWCGTAKGLIQFNPEKEVVMRGLRPIDGLPSWSFNRGASMKSRLTGELFFGTNEGLCWFHPDSLTIPTIQPLVAFTKCAITRENGTDSTLAVQAGTAHFAGGAIELSHTDKALSFEMAALDFKSSADNEYAYKLDGFDKDWNFTGNRRFASYTSLPDGDYTLRIKAANADGVWNEAATTLRIRVRPPFWRTWWFLTLATVFTLGSTVSITRFALRRRLESRLERVRLEQQIERERLEKALEVERERRRISQDIHDEVGSGLTKILMLSQNASEAGQQSSEISLAAQGVIDGMQEIIWSINPKNDTLQSLVAFIRSYGREFVSAAGINVTIETPEDLAIVPLRTDVRRNVFLAVKEALNNAVKYAAATEVCIRLEIEAERYIFTIGDNGKGFAYDGESLPTVRGGNGLANMRTRMEEIGGGFKIESSIGEGTRVVMTVPKGNEQPQ